MPFEGIFAAPWEFSSARPRRAGRQRPPPPSLKTQGGQERDPTDVILEFNRQIIDPTRDIAGTYKPQSAYYERWGAAGFAS